jgi:hypothetical protein
MPVGMRSRGGFPFERTFFQIETGDAMDGYRKVSVKAVFADELSERVIFWSLVSTSIIVSIAMLRGMLG